MNAQNAYNILSSSNAQRTAQKSKANRIITTFSLSDVFHRSSAQSSAARVPPKSLSISSTPDKVVHKAKPWAHATSLSNPSPPVSLAAIIDELEREECGANNAIPVVIVKASKLVSEEVSASAEIVEVPGLRSKQTVPTHPPPIPPPPAALGRKVVPKKAQITTSLRDFTSAFSGEASVNVASGDADGCEPHEVESVPNWTSLYDEEEDLSLPIPSWMMQHLPAQPPPIPPPPSKPSKAAGKEPDKGKMKKGKNAEIQVPPSRSDEEKCKPRGSREIEGYLMAQAIGEPNWEMKFEETRPEVTLGLRSKVLPSGPPDVLPPPTVVKQQPAQPKKAKKSEKPKLATTVSSWSKPLQVDAPVRPKKAQKLPEWDDISSVDAVILPPCLRRVLPDGPPIASLPPSLEKKPKKKDGKHADSDLNSKGLKQSDVSLALFVPHSTNESHSATSNRHRRTTLASIEEDDAPVDVAAKIPERLRTKLPTEPPAIPPPPVHKSKSLNSAGNLGKSKSQPQDIRNTALQLSKSISEPLNRKHATINCGSPTPSSLGMPESSSSTVFDEEDWGSPALSASSLPERLRLRLPDGPPPVPEPPAPKGKQTASRRRKSVTASTSPPFSPSYTEGLYDAYLPDAFDLNDILDYSDYLYHTRYPSPPSPFSDDDTLIASPIPAELAPISRKLPDQPPSIPPPPMSPSTSRNWLGKQKRRPSVSNPLASFIPAYAREEDGQDSSGLLSPSSSDGLGLGSYVGDQREKLRNLRRDYAARTKGLQELQEERQKARSMKGGKGSVNGASVHWQIRWEAAKMHAFNAARNMVKESRLIERNGLLTYDLHGLMAEEARRIVIDILEEEYDCLDSKNARSFRLKLVTGRGAHSVNDARVKPAVQEALDDDGWDYTKHEGYFVVLGRLISGQDAVVENEMEMGKKTRKNKKRKNKGTDIAAQMVEHQTMVHLSESEFPVCGAALA